MANGVAAAASAAAATLPCARGGGEGEDRASVPAVSVPVGRPREPQRVPLVTAAAADVRRAGLADRQPYGNRTGIIPGSPDRNRDKSTPNNVGCEPLLRIIR